MHDCHFDQKQTVIGLTRPEDELTRKWLVSCFCFTGDEIETTRKPHCIKWRWRKYEYVAGDLLGQQGLLRLVYLLKSQKSSALLLAFVRVTSQLTTQETIPINAVVAA
jgi:hypothetical protein